MDDREELNIRECEERLRFETLLTDLSARFVNLPASEVDAEIETAQRRVCECLELDISTFWEWEAEGSDVLLLTHLYRPLAGPPLPERMTATENFPWCLEMLLRHQVVVVSRTEDAPEAAAVDLAGWRHFGIKSNLGFSLAAGGGKMVGVLSFCTTQAERRWTEPLVRRLGLVAQVFANAVVRKRTEQALRESEARLGLAADAADAGLWGLNLSTGQYWLTNKARKPFAFAPEEVVTLDRVLQVVHPEDRDLVRRTVEEVVASVRDGRIEYRIIGSDGGIRWLQSLGRVQTDLLGNKTLMGVTLDITERKIAEQKLHQALDEVQELRGRLELENVYLQDQMRSEAGHGTIIGESEPVLKMLALARKVAPTESAVLITGETGTGKELLAQAIHDLSPRKKKLMVKVNCAALPAPLIESELFGREKGAYTGAMSQQVGRFELASGSTILLDEIGDLPLDLQAKLLRVLQDGQFERLGSHRTLTTDVRVIAATNRDLPAMVKEGKFREDLFHRLNVFPIETPPLRTRTGDIPMLAWKLVEEFNAKMGRSIDSIPKAAMESLKRYAWPGNIRELRNVIERAMIVSDGRSLRIELPSSGADTAAAPVKLEDVERQHILQVLESTHWRISGEHGAAEILGLLPTTLHSRLKKLGLSRAKR